MAGLLVVVAVAVAALGPQVLGSSSPSAAAVRARAASVVAALRPGHPRVLGEADGAVPDGTSVFDDHVPGVARLQPGLAGALRDAATRAAEAGVRIEVDSGWRSPDYQEHLLREAVATYGSTAEAARWVATPETSAHVSGDAVDVGPAAAAAWLGRRGARHGLCPVYGNEPWHFELRPEAVDRGCPATYPDPTYDPRMRR